MADDPQIDPTVEAELPDQELETAVFGLEVERFLSEDRIGKAIVKRAREDMESAKDELVTADASDREEIQRIQFKYRVAASVIDWLREIIVDGENARKLVEER